MLKTLACPSYVQTQHKVSDQNLVIDVALVPYDQFHTFMTDTHTNNMQIIEVNTLLEDLTKVDSNGKLSALISRAKQYLSES